ncbi:MAG: rhomboid family intramembrane serine protease, partial [Muribaculaceae bacterium]|nr:rhomboid family intramembrane serine protease [Muribaculaceae bacterium]
MFRNLSGFAASIPPVTKNIIIINLIIWVVEAIFPRFADTIVNVLGLHYFSAGRFNPSQVLTYLFVHDPSSPAHVFFNMFT